MLALRAKVSRSVLQGGNRGEMDDVFVFLLTACCCDTFRWSALSQFRYLLDVMGGILHRIKENRLRHKKRHMRSSSVPEFISVKESCGGLNPQLSRGWSGKSRLVLSCHHLLSVQKCVLPPCDPARHIEDVTLHTTQYLCRFLQRLSLLSTIKTLMTGEVGTVTQV